MNDLFPRDKAQYSIMAAGTTPESTAIFKAKHVNPETGAEVLVGIKIVKDVIQMEGFFYFATQVHEASTLDHENLLKVHCSFKNEDEFWIIMSPPGLSVRSIIRSYFRQGLPKKSVGFILKETLKALHYMHERNKLHGNMGSDCIFLYDNSRLKLAHSSLIYQHQSSLNSEDDHYSETILALEIMAYYGIANDKATDVLMFGFLALELFYDRQIFACSLEEFQVLVRNIEIRAKGRSNNININNIIEKLGVVSCFHGSKKNKKIISKQLAEVMAACLSRDPKKRPTTKQLLEFDFFNNTFKCSKLIKKTASLDLF